MWSFEHTEQTTATPERLWAYYVDAVTVPLWDPLVAEIRRNGPFATGTTGTSKPPQGPRVKSLLTEVAPYTSYTEVNQLPFARLSWTHRITPTQSGSTLTHGVIFSGPLSSLFALFLSKNFAHGIPLAMQRLVQFAEQGPPELHRK